MDPSDGALKEVNPNCPYSFICGTSISNAEDPSYTNDIKNDYDSYTDDYYGFDPELVCMQYQYYIAISTLIMICFASFVCMTVIILNKIKDHQTVVHIRM